MLSQQVSFLKLDALKFIYYNISSLHPQIPRDKIRCDEMILMQTLSLAYVSLPVKSGVPGEER